MRYKLTDFEWAAIEPMLPNKASGGDERLFARSGEPDFAQ